MAEPILIERADAIATVIINRPEKRNALNLRTWQKVAETFSALSQEDDLRCIVIRGAGIEAFAAGADISGFETERSNIAQVKHYSDVTHAALQAIADCRHPTVAMIRGFCLGGGFELATYCDLRIASDNARLGIPVKLMGLYLGYEMFGSLISVVGQSTALEIVLEGRVYDAREAYAKGMVNRVVPDGDLEREAYATAARIAEGAPLSARWHKRAARRLAQHTPPTAAEIEHSFSYAESEDYKAAYRAFLAKEKPRFKGR
jgi:enoyl-CoA hydratase/carnithine racemase